MTRWRKQYSSQYKRKLDEQLGFFLCLVINAILLIASYTILLSLTPRPPWDTILLAIPWVINIGILLLALLIRPGLATGYLYFLFIALLVPTVLSILFVASCIVSLPFLTIIGGLAGQGAMIIYIPCLGILFLIGLTWCWNQIFKPLIVDWWNNYGLPPE